MKVLVVDDQEQNRAILQVKLKAHGYASELAANGAEALEKLRRGKFDAVITDLLMPVMDGYQLTHAIKTTEEMKDIPVIIYTATYTDSRDEALARNLGANAFLVKPAADETFFTALADTIARSAKGEFPSGPVTLDELQRLRDYTARLIHKLEDKVAEVSALNATLQQRVDVATAELREANAELEAYVNSATHDLRAPLRAIEAYSTMLLEGTEPAGGRDRLLERIAANARQMQQLMQDLLDYSRLKERDVKPVPVDLGEVVTQAMDRVAAEIEQTKAEIRLPSSWHTVRAVGPILVQALANLLSNALKFVRPGVRPQVWITVVERAERVRLAVRDNGIGIPPADRGRIFRVFERLNEASRYPGTGLGLATVKRAVQKMGGDLGFESDVGVGSEFWIELPRA